MYAKKVIAIGATISSLMFLAGCGSAQPSTTDNTKTTELTGTTTVEVPTNLSASEQCVELMAYALKGVEYQKKGDVETFMVRAKKVDALAKSYNITGTDYSALCNTYITDPTFMPKVQKRVTEL
ncbi:MAG: hypothetical protein NTX91_04515 [candidate division SR1 bacterium]|nr:hypothetical protein [candidate division SR1 bacterium]